MPRPRPSLPLPMTLPPLLALCRMRCLLLLNALHRLPKCCHAAMLTLPLLLLSLMKTLMMLTMPLLI